VIEAQPEFCKTCHEMQFQYDTWKASTHADEANCLDCHTEPGVRGFIDAKVRALTELVAHITGKYEVPIRSNIRVTDQPCLKCHEDAQNIVDVNMDVSHDVHIENGVLCADCHSRVVHAAVGEPNVIQTNQCDDCHNSHNGFPIQGKHALLRCSDCHPNGVYTSVSTLCQDCHEVPENHVEGVYSNCEACHTDAGWDVIKFDHVTMSLKGGHSNLTCTDCHQPDTYSGLSPDCESCHSLPDLHVATDSKSCIDCHTVNGWSPAEFDHSFYELTGKHSDVSCSDCHIDRYEGTSTVCEDCHSAPVDHALNIDKTCELCHTTEGWSIVTYDHSAFPLTGGHSEVACVDCHIGGDIDNTSSLCEDCHDAPVNHAVNINTDCEICHSVAGWTPAVFDHSSYPLTGAHVDLACADCHDNGIFAGTPSDCIDCHSEPAYHSGLPNCVQCHTTNSFSPSTYRHPRIEEHYPSGEKKLGCVACHKSTYAEYSCTGAGCHSTNTPRDH
jgi:nitrate/TMAO reductase-like tetraheme cytochrome c subunit